jgi:tetratricopeptide (TPR) repeat protein
VLKYDPTNKYALKKKGEIEEILWTRQKQKILKDAKAGLRFAKDEKDLDKIIEELETIIEREPDFALPYFLSAKAFYLKYFLRLDEEQLKQARDFLEKGFKYDPMTDYYYIFTTDIDLIEYRGLLVKGAIRVALMEGIPVDWIMDMSPEAREYAGRLTKVLSRFEGIIPGTVAAEDPYKLYASGLYFYFLGDDEGAKKRLEEVLAHDRSIAEAMFALAEIYLFKYRNYERGIAYIEDYLQDRKNDNVVKTLLGFIYLINKQTDLSLKIWEQLPQNALTLYGKGLAKGSIEDLKQAIKIDKYFSEAYCAIGMIYLRQKKIDDAIQSFEKAIKIDPRFPEPFFYRGCAYAEAKRYDKALQDFAHALKLKIQNPNIFKYRAKVYLEREDVDLAIKDIDAFVELGFGDEESYLIRGMAYAKKKVWDKAISSFNNVLEINHRNVKALFERAKAYIERYKIDKAIEDLDKVIKLEPENAEAYIYRGIAYNKKGFRDKAIEDFNKAVRIKPGYAIYFQRGKIYLEMGEHELAMKDFDKVIKEKPDFYEAYTYRGHVKAFMKDYKGAIDDFNKAIKLNPDYIEAYSARARCYVSIKEFDKAIKDYTKALSINPKHSLANQIREKRAEVYEKLGQIDKAIRDIKRILEVQTRGDLFEKLADLYVKKRDFQSALTYYNKAIEKAGYVFRFIIEGEEWFAEALKKSRYLELYPLYIKRANVYKELGMFKEAEKDYNEAIKMAKEFPDEEGFDLYKAYLGLGQVYISIKDYQKAVDNFKEAIGEKPEEIKTYMLCAEAYYLKGDFRDAINICNQAVRHNPENPDAYIGRAEMRLKVDRELSEETVKDVLDDFQKAIIINPENKRAWEVRAGFWEKVAEQHTKISRGRVVYTKEGKKYAQNAIKDYDKLIELSPSEFEPYYRKAIIYKKLGKISDAIRVCKKFVQNKQYPPYQRGYASYTLGIMYLEKGIYKKALESLQMAIKLGFRRGEVYFEMAEICKKKRKYKEAEQNYEKALKLFDKGSKEYQEVREALERIREKIKK